MDKKTILKIRKELHNLPGKERGVTLPIRVMGPSTNYSWNEAECCFLWDDNNEILYIVAPNTVPTSSLDSRLYPMSIMAMTYESITFVGCAVDRYCLDRFLESKVADGLTNEETRRRYYNDVTALYDDHTYMMGDPSPTTEKRGLRPDDEIMDKNAVKFL